MVAPSAIGTLVRWPNALIAGAGVAIGAWWTGVRWFHWPVLAAIGAALALAAFANAINDIHDVEIDRHAHPERPLPDGRMSLDTAWRVAGVAGVMAVVLSLVARPAMGAATLLVLAVMWAYSRWVKRFGLAGNVVVAVVASLPFLYGGWAAGRPGATLGLVALAIPLHFAREVAKDLDDAPADAGWRRTIPVAHGEPAARVALLAGLLAFSAVLAPWVVREPRFGIFILPALVLCVLGAHRALRGQPGAPARLKLAMVLAMGAVVALAHLLTPPGPAR